jgi:hypothetical protein
MGANQSTCALPSCFADCGGEEIENKPYMVETLNTTYTTNTDTTDTIDTAPTDLCIGELPEEVQDRALSIETHEKQPRRTPRGGREPHPRPPRRTPQNRRSAGGRQNLSQHPHKNLFPNLIDLIPNQFKRSSICPGGFRVL